MTVVENLSIADYKYRYETHMHTSESSACGRDRAEDMARAYKEAGYDGIFITDHAWGGNTAVDRSLPWEEWVRRFALGYEHAKAWGDQHGLTVFFGYESGFEGTEFLIYGLTPDWMAAHPRLHDASIPEQLALVHSGGGMVVQAHPYRKEDYIPKVRLFPEWADGIEAVNATHTNHLSTAHKSTEWNAQAIALAKAHRKPMTAGSDCHSVTVFGGGVLTKEPLLCPQDYIDLVCSDTMYLLTDGDRIYDRYGTLLQTLYED